MAVIPYGSFTNNSMSEFNDTSQNGFSPWVTILPSDWVAGKYKGRFMANSSIPVILNDPGNTRIHCLGGPPGNLMGQGSTFYRCLSWRSVQNVGAAQAVMDEIHSSGSGTLANGPVPLNHAARGGQWSWIIRGATDPNSSNYVEWSFGQNPGRYPATSQSWVGLSNALVEGEWTHSLTMYVPFHYQNGGYEVWACKHGQQMKNIVPRKNGIGTAFPPPIGHYPMMSLYYPRSNFTGTVILEYAAGAYGDNLAELKTYQAGQLGYDPWGGGPPVGSGVNFASGSQTVAKFGVYEVVLTATGSYTSVQAYDVVANVTFTPPVGSGGSPITVEAFWDGGTTWRARCYAPYTGTWNWSTSSTDAGLSNKSGQFACGSGLLKGKIKKSTINPRTWITEDGNPFIFIVDTAYYLFGGDKVGFTGTITDADSQNYVTEIAAKNMTMIFTNLNGGQYFDAQWRNFWSDVGTYDLPHQTKFQRTDTRLKWMLNNFPDIYLNLQITVENSAGYGNDQTLWAGLTQARRTRYLRHVVARFAAFPEITWTITNDTDFSGGHPNNVNMVNEIGNYLLANDKWNNPRGTGAVRDANDSFTGQAWHSYVRMETNADLPADKMAGFTSIVKPYFNSEDRYEGDAGLTNPQYFFRWLFWSGILSVGGSTYGSTFYDDLSLYSARGSVGLNSVSLIKGYFSSRSIDIQDFVADDSIASDFDGATGARRPQTMRDGTDQYIIYHPCSNSSGIGAALKGTVAKIALDLSGAIGNVYTVEWFRASDGTVSAGANITGQAGSITMTAPWTGIDAVLRLKQVGAAPPPTQTIPPRFLGGEWQTGGISHGSLANYQRAQKCVIAESGTIDSVWQRVEADDGGIGTEDRILVIWDNLAGKPGPILATVPALHFTSATPSGAFGGLTSTTFHRNAGDLIFIGDISGGAPNVGKVPADAASTGDVNYFWYEPRTYTQGPSNWIEGGIDGHEDLVMTMWVEGTKDTVTATGTFQGMTVTDDFNRADTGPPPSGSWTAGIYT